VSAHHANFIVNTGAATAADVARLIDRCRAAVLERFGVQLRDEIVRLGFHQGPDVDSQD
jgi:UDP-N-acetylmuramate dehydrogenase